MVGVDTVRVRAPLASIPDPDRFDRHSVHRGRGATGATQTLSNGAQLRVDSRWGWAAAIEVSVPRYLTGSNLYPAAWTQAVQVIERLYEESRDYVSWAVPVRALAVTRLDPAKPFRGVDNVDHLLEGLRAVRPPRSGGVQTFERERGFNSLTRQAPGRWRTILYDKHAEMLHQAASYPRGSGERRLLLARAEEAAGVLRYEARVRRPALRDRGVETLQDVAQETIEAISRYYFKRAGYDVEVGSIDKVKATLLMASEESYKDLTKATLMLWLGAQDLPIPMCEKTQKKLRRLSKEAGLSAADLVDRQGDRSLRLDYDEGRLVVSGDPTIGCVKSDEVCEW
jgi:hypothetical protein